MTKIYVMPCGQKVISSKTDAFNLSRTRCYGCAHQEGLGECDSKASCDRVMEQILSDFCGTSTSSNKTVLSDDNYLTTSSNSTLSSDNYKTGSNKTKTNNFNEEEHKMFNFNFGTLFNKLAPDCCKLSMNGQIAVKTSDGEYKTYNAKTGRLTNCNNFVFDMGGDMFFTVPARTVDIGDIIIVKRKNGEGRPACVKRLVEDGVQCFFYDDNEIRTVVPETNMLMPNLYFYAKVYSPFGKQFFGKGKNSVKEIGRLAMMSAFFGNDNRGANPFGGNSNNGMNPMLMMMTLGGGKGFDFGEMFDFDFDMDDLGLETEADEEDADEVEETEKPVKPTKKTKTTKKD